MTSKMKQRCWLEGIGIGFALDEAVSATVPLGRLVFPAEPVERSDWSGGLRGAVAIAHQHPVTPLMGANDAKATAFSGRDERVAPLRSLSSMTRGASRDPADAGPLPKNPARYPKNLSRQPDSWRVVRV
jgi:hypothetical protein